MGGGTIDVSAYYIRTYIKCHFGLVLGHKKECVT